MSKTLKIVGLTLLAGGLAVGVLFTANNVMAQEPDPVDPTTPDSLPFGWHGRGGMRGGFDRELMGEHEALMHEALADALGMSVEDFDAARDEGMSLSEIAEAQGVDLADVQTAMEAVRADLIAQAVEDGTLTQEQADMLLERSAFGPRDMMGKFGGFDRELLGEYEDLMHETIAGALGMSVEDFDAARDEGMSLSEIAEAQGVDLADVRAAMEAVRADIIAQAVEDGTLTQEQADQMLERAAGGRLAPIDGGLRGGRGGRGDRGGCMGGPLFNSEG